MGGVDLQAPACREPTAKYHPRDGETLTRPSLSVVWTPAGGQFDWGGCLLKCNGGVYKGQLSSDGNRAGRANAKAGFTARPTSRAGTKVGLSDPAVPYGRAVAQRIKGTPGITGLSGPRVHIDDQVWHLDVGSSHPGAEAGPKGWAVRPLKRYVSWV